MCDSNGNGKLDLREFTKGMLQAKIHINPDEINYVYSVIDKDNSGEIDYKEFCDVIYGTRRIDTEKAIAEKRHREGRDTGIDPKLAAEMAKISMDSTYDKNSMGLRTAGSVSGMSDIMKRSENDNKPVNRLVDDTEGFRNFTEIKTVFL